MGSLEGAITITSKIYHSQISECVDKTTSELPRYHRNGKTEEGEGALKVVQIFLSQPFFGCHATLPPTLFGGSVA